MLTVINPATEEALRQSPELTGEEVAKSIEASAQAFEVWRRVSLAKRSQVLHQVADRMRNEEERLAILLTEEFGKPIKEGRAEVQKSAWCADHYAEYAEEYLATLTLASDASHSYVQHLPLGPILGVLPWNAPYWLAFRFCAPALMAGNTCLMKHDSHVPGCAQAIAELFQDVGAPDNIMINLPVKSPQVADIIRNDHVRAVSLTGSDKAGSSVAAVAGAEIKPCVLELGGSDPAIVLADADIEAAAAVLAFSRIINAGQSCIAAKRLIVEAPVYDQFNEAIKKQLAALKVGDPTEEDTDIGPIARPDLRDNLARQVDETVAAGARCLLGGKVPEGKGYFYPVTLLVDVTGAMTACREETFGPVAVVQKAESAEEALAMANDTQYGLAASIWTERERGEAMAREIVAGQVAINGLVKTDPRLPSGGVKKSGYGRELGPHGIMEFVNVQQIWIGPKQD